MAIDFNQSSRNMLLQLINQDNEEFLDNPLTFNLIQFGVPAASVNANRNTQVEITPNPQANVAGLKVVYYNRLDMEQFFTGGISIVPEQGEVIDTSSDILDRINTEYGLLMLPEDIIVEAVDGSQGATWNLRANPNSYLWYGEALVTITAPAIDLDEVIQVTELAGFEYPEAP